LIPLKNDEVIGFLIWPLADFSAWKNVQAKTPIQ